MSIPIFLLLGIVVFGNGLIKGVPIRWYPFYILLEVRLTLIINSKIFIARSIHKMPKNVAITLNICGLGKAGF